MTESTKDKDQDLNLHDDQWFLRLWGDPRMIEHVWGPFTKEQADSFEVRATIKAMFDLHWGDVFVPVSVASVRRPGSMHAYSDLVAALRQRRNRPKSEVAT